MVIQCISEKQCFLIFLPQSCSATMWFPFQNELVSCVWNCSLVYWMAGQKSNHYHTAFAKNKCRATSDSEPWKKQQDFKLVVHGQTLVSCALCGGIQLKEFQKTPNLCNYLLKILFIEDKPVTCSRVGKTGMWPTSRIIGQHLGVFCVVLWPEPSAAGLQGWPGLPLFISSLFFSREQMNSDQEWKKGN